MMTADHVSHSGCHADLHIRGGDDAEAAKAMPLPMLMSTFQRTLPTAASPSKTSLTLLLGFGGAAPAESAIVCRYGPRRQKRP